LELLDEQPERVHRLPQIVARGSEKARLGAVRLREPLQRVLGLVEQAHILDSDDGLCGEGRDEIDLALVKSRTSGR
jgi:hypothetical protein